MRASGKRPTRRHKEIMAKWKLNVKDWLVTRDLPDGNIYIKNKVTGKEKIIRERVMV